MSIKRIFAGAIAVAVTLCGQALDTAELKFREALHKEQVEGDLSGAIKLYQSVATAGNRALAAKALLNLGRCYEKRGSTDARKVYEKLLSTYSDQSEPAREARIRLAKLNPGAARELSARRLTRPLSTFQIATVSRDGRYAAYVIRRRSIPMLVDLTAGTERELGTPGQRLVALDDYSNTAAISPDGSQVAFDRCRAGGIVGVCELRIIGVKAAEARIVSRELIPFYIADWSRDGSMLLLREFAGRDGRWLLVNVLTGQTGTLALPPSVGLGASSLRRYAQARFSPDGRWIACTSTDSAQSRKSRVIVMSLDGRVRTPVTDDTTDAYVFGWSARGDRLFFVGDQSGSFDLWASPVQDGKVSGVPTLLRKDFGLVQGSGVSDDGRLYYSLVSDIGDAWTGELDVAGATIRGLRRISQPRGALTSNPTWSPDGKRLLLNRRDPPTFGSVAIVREMESGQEREVKPPSEHLRYMTSPDGARIALYQSCWAPDGRSMCFGMFGDEKWTLMVSDPDSGEVKAKVDLSAPVYNWPVLLPDGKHAILARSGNLRNVSPVVRVDLQSGEERRFAGARRKRTACPRMVRRWCAPEPIT